MLTVQHTMATCPGKPCSIFCSHVETINAEPRAGRAMIWRDLMTEVDFLHLVDVLDQRIESAKEEKAQALAELAAKRAEILGVL